MVELSSVGSPPPSILTIPRRDRWAAELTQRHWLVCLSSALPMVFVLLEQAAIEKRIAQEKKEKELIR